VRERAVVVVSACTMTIGVNSRGLHGSVIIWLVLGVLTYDASAIARNRLPSVSVNIVLSRYKDLIKFYDLI